MTFGRKSIESLKSSIKRNDVRFRVQEEIQFFDDNHNNIKSAFTLISDPIDS